MKDKFLKNQPETREVIDNTIEHTKQEIAAEEKQLNKEP